MMKKRQHTGRHFFIILGALAACAAFAGDWPAINGNMDHTGVVAESPGLPLASVWIMQADHAPSPAFPKRITGRFEYNPAAQDYVFHPVIEGSRLAFGSSTEEAVYCLDTASGKTLWKVHLDGAVRAAPVWHQGKLIVGTDGGSVYGLDGATGNEVWRFSAGPDRYQCIGNQRIVSPWVVRGAPIVENGAVYVAAGVYPTLGAFLYALKADTGDKLWEQPILLTPNGLLRPVDGDKLWISSGAADPGEFFLPDGRPVIPDPDRRRGRGGWWLGDVCGIPAWGPADNDIILFRLSTEDRPGTMRNSSVRQENILPQGIHTGIHGLCAIGDDKFYLLGRENEVMAVPKAAFREVCTQRVEEIKAEKRWTYGWVMAAELPEDQPFGDAVRSRAAWKVKIPEDTAPGLRWGIKAGPHLFYGGAGRVIALDSATGDVVWSHAVEGEARGLAVADGALFVSTEQGQLYCFRQGASSPVKHTPSFSNPYGDNALYEEAARAAVKSADRTVGYCVVLGVGEGELAYRIAKESDFFVVGLDPDADKVAVARKKLAQAGVYGKRVVVHHKPQNPPALVTRFANLVVSDSAIAEGSVPYAPKSALRLVQPYTGTIMLGSRKGMDIGDAWTHSQFSKWVTVKGSSGTSWHAARRGALPGAGEWTHAFANPENTVSSGDTLVSTDFQLQWFGPPGMPDMVERHSMAMNPLVKNGIMYRMGGFYPSKNSTTTLTAIDAYNGTMLWATNIPFSGRKLAGHNTHAYACIGDSIFVASGPLCHELDGISGRMVRTFEGVKPGFDRGYVGGWNDYLIGSSQGADVNRLQKPQRMWRNHMFHSRPASSRDLFVDDLQTGERRWTYEGGAILNVSITGDRQRKRIYFVESRNPAAMNDTTGQLTFSEFMAREGDAGPRIVALDMKTGNELWSKPITRNVDKPQQWVMYMTLADGVLLTSRVYFQEHEEKKDLWYGYDFEALDAEAQGRTLWHKWLSPEYVNRGATWKNPMSSHPFYARGKFWFMARYFGAVYHFDPRTGEMVVDDNFGRGWEQAEAKSCTPPTASESAFYFRRNSHFLYDLEARDIKDMTRVSRPACWMSMIPAGGLITMLEQSTGCKCGFAVRLSLAFAAPSDDAEL